MNRRTVIRLAAAALGIALLVVGWLVLAPRELGGVTSYALIDGTSMNPSLEEGDLVLLQPRSTYGVGDVVAYRSRQLDRVVLHRIVARDGSRYVFKGDANNFRDPDRPGAADLVGSVWVTIPGVGTALSWLRSPLHAGLVVGGLVALFLLVGGGSAGAARRKRTQPGGAELSPSTVGGLARILTGTATVLGVAALVVGVVAFTRPTTQSVTVADAYRQHGVFSYRAAVAPDGVYPTGSVRTGDPVFLRLVDRLEVGFRYRLAGADRDRTSGTAGLVARLADASGWHQDIVLQTPSRFEDDSVSVGGVLDLAAISAQVAQFEKLTGVDSATYTLTLVPSVTASSTVSGRAIASTYAPSLPFGLDDLRLAPAVAASGAPAAFTRSQSGSITRSAPASLSVIGHRISVSAARILALSLGLFALLAAGLAALVRSSARRRGESVRIAASLGPRLVALSGPFAPGDARVVDVDSIETLARLADHHGRPILHETSDDLNSYFVEEGNSIFRYRVSDREPSGRSAQMTQRRVPAG